MTPLIQQSWLLVIVSASCNCAGTLLLKQSRLAANYSAFWSSSALSWLMAALLSYIAGLLVFAKALDYLPVSAVVPFSTGFGFLLTIFLSHWLFKETLTVNQLTASGLILAGIIVMTH